MSKEKFINIDDYLTEYTIYQIQLENEKMSIKRIGKSKTSDHIQIFKNVGQNNNISLYSVVYTEEELKECLSTGGMFDLLKLHEKHINNNIITNLCITINENIFEKGLENYVTKEFDIYLISEIEDKENKFIKKIEKKDLNKTNMVQRILETHQEMKKSKDNIK
jgi:hypothetical protein